MAMNVASGALPIVPLVTLSSGTGNGTTSVDWTRFKLVFFVFRSVTGGNMAVTVGGNSLGTVVAGGTLPVFYTLGYLEASSEVVGSSFGGGVTGGGALQAANSTVAWTVPADCKYAAYAIAQR